MTRNSMHRNGQMMDHPVVVQVGMRLMSALNVVFVVVPAFLAMDGVEYQIDQDLGDDEEVADVMMGGGMDSLTPIRAHQHAYHLYLRRQYLVLPSLNVQKENPWH